MASSAACTNMLARMRYSTGQGACQQHANTTGDPPFPVGKTRLCSSAHSLPPTAGIPAPITPLPTGPAAPLGKQPRDLGDLLKKKTVPSAPRDGGERKTRRPRTARRLPPPGQGGNQFSIFVYSEAVHLPRWATSPLGGSPTRALTPGNRSPAQEGPAAVAKARWGERGRATPLAARVPAAPHPSMARAALLRAAGSPGSSRGRWGSRRSQVLVPRRGRQRGDGELCAVLAIIGANAQGNGSSRGWDGGTITAPALARMSLSALPPPKLPRKGWTRTNPAAVEEALPGRHHHPGQATGELFPGVTPYPDMPRPFPNCAVKTVAAGWDALPPGLPCQAPQAARTPARPAAPLHSQGHPHLLPPRKTRAVVPQKKLCSPVSTDIQAMKC